MKYRRWHIITEYVCSKYGKLIIISNGTKIILFALFFSLDLSFIQFDASAQICVTARSSTMLPQKMLSLFEDRLKNCTLKTSGFA